MGSRHRTLLYAITGLWYIIGSLSFISEILELTFGSVIMEIH